MGGVRRLVDFRLLRNIPGWSDEQRVAGFLNVHKISDEPDAKRLAVLRRTGETSAGSGSRLVASRNRDIDLFARFFTAF